MRSTLLSPHTFGAMRGNITTVRRIDRHLRNLHVSTQLLAADTLSTGEMIQQSIPFDPGVIHAFHARQCGTAAMILARHFQVPFIITITGGDLHDPALRDHPATKQALAGAAAIVCFSRLDADELARHSPALARRITVIPQGVEVLPDSGRRDFAEAEHSLLLLPAALRPVKNVEYAISASKTLWERNPNIHLASAGGEIDRGYARDIRAMLAVSPWAEWLGEVPDRDMGALYRRADLVLNCSLSEGMSNSLMEAMSLGRPVLAADIPGNRALIDDGETGWLFHDEATFIERATALMGNLNLREELGKRAQKKVAATFSPHTEAACYLQLYEQLI